MRKRIALLLAAATLVLANLVVASLHFQGRAESVRSVGSSYRVCGIRVMDNDLYEVRYYEGRTERCSLVRTSVRSKQGSKGKVINFLNKVERPRLVVESRTPECLVGDFVFSFRGSDVKFSQWLHSNRLSYG